MTHDTLRYFYHPESDGLFTRGPGEPDPIESDPLIEEVSEEEYHRIEGLQSLVEDVRNYDPTSAPSAGGHSERAHSSHGASGASRWMYCSGSVYMLENSPRRPSSASAKQGTHAHELLEMALMGIRVQPQDCDPYDRVEMMAAIQEAVDWVTEIMEANPGAVLYLEKPFTITEEVWGTNDVSIYAPLTETLYVMDFKYGVGLVRAKGNKQLRIYGLGAIRELAAEGKPVSHVEITICQPRCPDEVGETTRTENVDIVDLFDFFLEVEAAVQRTKDASRLLELLPQQSQEAQDEFWAPGGKWTKVFSPSPDACQWCVSATCRAVRESVRENLPAVPDDLIDMGEWSPPDVTAIETQRLLAIKKADEMIKKFLKAVSMELLVRGLQGADLGDQKIVNKQARRKFLKDQEIVLKGLDELSKGALSKEAFVVPKIKGIGEVEQALLTGLPTEILNEFGSKKAERLRNIKTAMAELMDKTSGGGYVIVDKSDKRQAIEVDPLAEIDFDAIADIGEMEEYSEH